MTNRSLKPTNPSPQQGQRPARKTHQARPRKRPQIEAKKARNGVGERAQKPHLSPKPRTSRRSPAQTENRRFGQSAWWAGVDVYRQNGGGGFDYVTTVTSPAVMGQLTGPLYPGPVDRWDKGNTLSVLFYAQAGLLSVTEAQVFSGANALAVKNPTGAWEVVQFATAILTGANSYNLTRLLRGQLGTEAAMGTSAAPIPAGARVVVLDPAVLGILTEPVDNRALAQTLRYGPGNGQVTDPSFTQITMQLQGVGLRPWSVSQIRGVRALPATDVTVTWARRTRFAGDSWDPDVVPLNEDDELYSLAILGLGGSVVRSVFGLTTPTWTYPAALQVADFGAPQPAYTIRIAQLSALFGPGQAATTTVTL